MGYRALPVPDPRRLHCVVKYQNKTHGKMCGASRGLGSLPTTAPCIVFGHVATFFRLHQRKDDFSMWNFISRKLQAEELAAAYGARSKHQGQWYFLTLK